MTNSTAMATSGGPEDEVRRLFQKHVPEVASGVVELVSIARAVGDRVLVAVRSNDPAICPMLACIGEKGIQLKNITRELGGEKLSIVRWNKSPKGFILATLGQLAPEEERMPKPEVTFDGEAHIACVHISPETLVYLSEQGRSRFDLESRLVGWDIRFVTHDRP